MAEHRAPRHLFDAFIGADEKAKSRIRVSVIKWMSTLNLKAGDRVIAPHPITGEEEVFTRGETVQ